MSYHQVCEGEKVKRENKKIGKYVLLMFSVILFSIFFTQTFAEPNGLSISSNASETSLTTDPDNLSNEGGTITTLVVSAIQQNSRWKAYIGNLTGQLTLQLLPCHGQKSFAGYSLSLV